LPGNRTALFILAVLVIGLGVTAGLLWRGDSPRLRSRSFQFQYVTRVPALPAQAQKLRIWIPVPESNEQQQISGLTLSSPVPYEIHREPEYGNPYAYIEVAPPQAATPLEVKMSFQVTRAEHRVLPVRSASLESRTLAKPADTTRFLQPDRLVPIDGIIVALAEQETRGLRDPLEKARAIYNYVVKTMQYDKSGEGWGRGDAIYACNVRKGNCTDFHALFIGMMRAAGIPARFEIGFPVPPDLSKGEIPGYHCWAQFYLEGVGWIPVDASEAWQNASLRDYFFGAHDENRVLFSRGRDIRFNPPQSGEPWARSSPTRSGVSRNISVGAASSG
jgi:transglutaminase-like putative cysteine protease